MRKGVAKHFSDDAYESELCSTKHGRPIAHELVKSCFKMRHARASKLRLLSLAVWLPALWWLRRRGLPALWWPRRWLPALRWLRHRGLPALWWPRRWLPALSWLGRWLPALSWLGPLRTRVQLAVHAVSLETKALLVVCGKLACRDFREIRLHVGLRIRLVL